MSGDLAAVTGAFSFTGQRIAERLLADGCEVVTLTNHPTRESPVTDRVRAHPYRFDDVDAMADSLAGADALYNTFWMRPESGDYAPAVENTRRLVAAAERAGVDRIVHLSVSNADASALPYYEAKAAAEDVVREAGASHAVLRPTWIFGRDDLLFANLAYFLRRLPVFPVFGDGDYPVQPVFVGDVADVAVARGGETDDATVDVAGPTVYAYRDLLGAMVEALGTRCRLVPTPTRLARLGVEALEVLLRDRLLSRAEIRGLTAGLLATGTPAAGETEFADWLADAAEDLGTEYTRFRDRYGV